MNETIICLQELPNPDGEVQIIFRIEQPSDVADAEQARQLVCDPKGGPFSDLKTIAANDRQEINGDLVQEVGREVLDVLSEHPGVRQAIDRAVSTQGAGPWPIYIETSAIDAEEVPWELLYHPTGKFLSLDPRWPIARQTGGRSDPITHQFREPLRLAAVIGAADVPGGPEWEALRTAVVNANLGCQVTVFVADPALQTYIENQGDDFVSVEPIPETGEALIDRLIAAEPQLLHIFCHGSSSYAGYLEISTRNHVALGREPLYLSSGELARMRELVWLITLNACEGATPADELHSYAYSLVKEGIPAAIGMREPIDSLDANVFCQAFYSEAFAALAPQLQQDQTVTLNWAPLLRAARNALCTQHQGPVELIAARHKHWTLPVLYQRPAETRVEPMVHNGGLNPDEQARGFAALETLRTLRAELQSHPDTPEQVVDQIDEQIQALLNQLSGAVPV